MYQGRSGDDLPHSCFSRMRIGPLKMNSGKIRNSVE